MKVSYICSINFGINNKMWYYNNEVFQPTEEYLKQYQGFVYLITELDTDIKYIGKKFFWSTRKLPPLKGKSRKRIKVIESDWDYG